MTGFFRFLGSLILGLGLPDTCLGVSVVSPLNAIIPASIYRHEQGGQVDPPSRTCRTVCGGRDLLPSLPWAWRSYSIFLSFTHFPTLRK